MAENKHQMGKFVNKPSGVKSGCKLLGLEGYFATGTKNPAEPTNLCRLVLRANDNTDGKSLKLTANIPVAEIPSILSLTEAAFIDFTTGEKALKQFSILDGVAKPKESDVNEEGTLVYSVDIAYNPTRNNPIAVTVKNFRANVTKDATGRLKYDRPSGVQQTVVYALKIRDFYNAVAHLDTMYKAWCAKTAIEGNFDGAF